MKKTLAIICGLVAVTALSVPFAPITYVDNAVSNAVVTASALASAALPRAEVTNAVDALVAVTNGANRYGLATTSALTSVSNAAVSAYELATNAQTRLTSANAGANISIAPKAAYKWDVTSGEVLSKYRVLYTHDFKDRLGECYTAYTDEALTAKAEMEDPELPGHQQHLGVYDSGDIQIGYDLYSVGNSTRDSSFAPSFIIISAPNAQTTNNIVTEISASSDDAHYPSAKAAYDCATNAASVATSDMETQTHAEKTYQAKGDYATTAYVASITNAQNIAIGLKSSAHSTANCQTAIGNQAKATNFYSSAFGFLAHSHGIYTINFSQATNRSNTVGSLSNIYFGDFTLRQMVTNDTQLWQDCASYSASSSTVYVALQNSVQGVVIPIDATMTVSPPPAIEGRIRDWVVDCICDTNTTVVLTGGLFKAADNTVTNIAAGVPTTLYFSESPLGFIKVGKAELKEGL